MLSNKYPPVRISFCFAVLYIQVTNSSSEKQVWVALGMNVK